MDNLKAIYNIDSKNWNFELNNDLSTDEIQIAFCSNSGPAEFNGLRFGYEVFDKAKSLPGESFVQGSTFPLPGIKYEVATTTKPFITEKISYKPNKTYSIKLWAENNEERGEGEYEIFVPKPEKEFNSWLWNDEKSEWEPPIPRPEGKPAVWHEDNQEWVEISDPTKIPIKPAGFDSWTWSEDEKSWVPPVPKPESEVPVRWDEATQSWMSNES